MRKGRKAEERKVAGALDWFANTLSEFGSPDDPDPVDDLAGVLDGDRDTAALLWARFTRLTPRAQVFLQTIQGERELRAWLESIILYGSEDDYLQLRRDGSGAFYAYYPPTNRVVRWTRDGRGAWGSKELSVGARVVDMAAEVGRGDLPAELAELLRRDSTGDYAELFGRQEERASAGA